MSFFKQLSEIADGIALTIRIHQKSGTMAVSVIPDGIDKVLPLITNGTPEWLDENFIRIIKAPVEHVKGVIVNAEAFKDARPKDCDEKIPASSVAKTKDKPKPKTPAAEKPSETKDTSEKPQKPEPAPTALELLMS